MDLTMDFKPLERTKLAQDISSSIMEMINNGQLLPKQKLPTENELATAFHVSRNVVRESLKTLELLGIVEAKVAKGTYITANVKENMAQYEFWEILQKHSQMKDLYEVRLSLEPELAYYAAKRRTEEDLQKMREFLSGITKSSEFNDYASFFDMTYAFHFLIARASQNRIMEKLLVTIYGQIKLEDIVKFAIEKSIYTNQVGHEKIFSAIENQQADKAKKLMFDHIYPVYAFLQKCSEEN